MTPTRTGTLGPRGVEHWGRFDPTTAVTVSPNTLTVSTPEFLLLLNEGTLLPPRAAAGTALRPTRKPL